MSGPAASPTRFTIRNNKLVDYLLDLSHPRGGSKARFFLAFGFSLPSGSKPRASRSPRRDQICWEARKR
ncbi:DUF6883 domain-containing protein [Methylobacterium sp. Leaf89]|uniref:DUF6883 domain-containing protein n=1 Tax=Methylobacterium sp. Leaf89 TaxID=1736245 RepID=UPI0032972A42